MISLSFDQNLHRDWDTGPGEILSCQPESEPLDSAILKDYGERDLPRIYEQWQKAGIGIPGLGAAWRDTSLPHRTENLQYLRTATIPTQTNIEKLFWVRNWHKHSFLTKKTGEDLQNWKFSFVWRSPGGGRVEFGKWMDCIVYALRKPW